MARLSHHTDFSWMIGGPQGSGVESGANVFSKMCAGMGYHIFGKREFYSNIKGEHSYFTVRVSDKPISSNVNHVDVLTAFDAETIFRHCDEMALSGAIIYDADLESVTSDSVATLDPNFKERLHSRLAEKNKPFTVRGALESADNVCLLPVSFRGILSDLADKTGNPKLRNLVRMFNIMGVSMAAALLHIPQQRLIASVHNMFAKKPLVAQLNADAAAHSYNFMAAKSPDFGVHIPGTKNNDKDDDDTTTIINNSGGGTILVQGFEGTSLGKMVAGCRFQSYYPITPASDESMYLESHDTLKIKDPAVHGSTIVVQTEDEISAIGMMIGAALTGARSSTSTSGPGFALMAEALGWAGINEVPVVITLYQRSGPSTGLPTRHGQDDLAFAVNAGHGDFPRMVYASGDVEESFYDTCRCFNYSDTFQLPVIHMMDKFLSGSVVTCKRFDPNRVDIQRGKLVTNPAGDYKRFALTPDGISPRTVVGADGGIFWNTGDERDELGHITEDPVVRTQMMDKRMSRLDRILETVPKKEQVAVFGIHPITIISWGSTKGPILDAIRLIRDKNGGSVDIGFVQIKLIHPFPAQYVTSLLDGVGTLVNIESNYSAQLHGILRQNTGLEADYHILKYTGRGMTSTELYRALDNIVQNKAKKREVLMHGQ